MPVTGDIFSITTKAQYLGQEIVNVWWYRYDDTLVPTVGAKSILDAWVNTVLGQILPFQLTDLTYTSARLDNYTTTQEEGEIGLTNLGSVVGVPLPSYVAANVKLVRTNKTTRHGFKRIAGISEAHVDGNTYNQAAALTSALQLVCTGGVIVQDPDPATDYALENLIVGRTKDANGVYQVDTSRVQSVRDVIVNDTISTQNSRKRGSGQ